MEVNFEAEEALIDQYVEQKPNVESEMIATRLIEEFFLPQGRIVEALLWRDSLTSSTLRGRLEEALESSTSTGGNAQISRVPKNVDWGDTPAVGKPRKTNDQQYHYNRTLSYMTATGQLADDVTDIRTCPHEWVTFVARDVYVAGMNDYGVEFNTLAAAVSDYIDFYLEDAVMSANSNGSSETEFNRLKIAISTRPEMADLVARNHAEFLDAGFLANFPEAKLAAVSSKSSELLFTTEGVILLSKKFQGRFTGESSVIPAKSIRDIEIGSDLHTEYRGVTSTTSSYWTISINTTDFQSFTRWIWIGNSEDQMNQIRPGLVSDLQEISKIYDLREGDDWQTSGGFKTSYGFFF